jgi:hypothetical protein
MAPFDAAHPRPGTLTWPERIENYRRMLDVPYLSYENGWTYGTWLMGNCYRKANNHYGGFQGNFLRRIAVLFPDCGRVLHMFAGRVASELLPGDTLDIDPKLNPTYCTNAETCTGADFQDRKLRPFQPAGDP